MMPNNIFCCNGQHYVYMPNGPGVQGAQPGYPAAVPQHPVYQFPGASQPAQPPPPPPPRERSCPSVQAAHAVAAALPQQNGLVADLCKIIERQSQEIASLVQVTPSPLVRPPLQPRVSAASVARVKSTPGGGGSGKSAGGGGGGIICSTTNWRVAATVAADARCCSNSAADVVVAGAVWLTSAGECN